MPNYHFSPRGSFAVMLPSTNVAVEAEYGQMLVPGVSWHSGRILIRDPVLDSDAKFDQFMVDLRKEIGSAVENVMTAVPDFMGAYLRQSYDVATDKASDGHVVGDVLGRQRRGGQV